MSATKQKMDSSAAYAKAFGSIAFAKGIKCAPAMDAEFMQTLEGRSPDVHHAQSMRDMKAWIAGWVEACVADPMDEVAA